MFDFESYCKHNDIDYSIAYNELDYYPRGFVFKKPNGRYHITLNGKHDVEQLKKTLVHELVHLHQNHLDLPTQFKDLAEKEANCIVKELNTLLSF